MQVEPLFFASTSAFRKWFEKNHGSENELWVGFHKTKTGKPSITWPESVDVALCFGWIDGIRKSIDHEAYMIRFTPRKKSSVWSNVNINKVEELKKAGLMTPAGLKAYSERKEHKSGIYSFEQKIIRFDAASEKKFRANKKAWKWFSTQAPSYQKAATWWIMSAKKEETKSKRLEILVKDSENGIRIAPLRRG